MLLLRRPFRAGKRQEPGNKRRIQGAGFGFPKHYFPCSYYRESFPIRSVPDERVPDICHSYNAGDIGNFCQAQWVSVTRDPFVMAVCRRDDLRASPLVCQKHFTQVRVFLYLDSFFQGECAGFSQDVARYEKFARIMQQAASRQQFLLSGVSSKQPGIKGNSSAVQDRFRAVLLKPGKQQLR
jgi:hypothetical protein